jgi:cytochrome P450
MPGARRSGALVSALDSPEVLRPGPGGFKQVLMNWGMAAIPFGFRLMRRFKPMLSLGGTLITSRYDDVREVFQNDALFAVPYKTKLDVIMGGEPFFLEMRDTPAYHAGVNAMRKVVLPEDLGARLAPGCAEMAGRIVAEGEGRLEVVDALCRRVTFDLLGDYFGVPKPPNGDLRVWGTRLFEFQFADGGNDPALRKAVDEIAPALRAHIDGEIARRRAAGAGGDDVLGRCLALQAAGEPGFSDVEIRTALMGFIVGGPPQPPMVVPQALEQLLRRPDALKGAQDAAREDDDALLAGYVFEAMRFDPLAPALPRTATADGTIAAGTSRARNVKAGQHVMAAMSSAMMDERQVPEPRTFDPMRTPPEFMHFGCGLHTCFGIHINKVILPGMLKPLLKRPNLRRAPGKAGHLSKRGPFSDALTVLYD